METKKQLKNSAFEKTPDIYLQNEILQEETKTLKEFVEKSKIEVGKTKQMWEKMKKESDYYKMHYSRWVAMFLFYFIIFDRFLKF